MSHWYHDHAIKYAWLFHYQTGTELAIDHLQSLVQTEFSGDIKLMVYHADGDKNLISKDTRDFLTASGTWYTGSSAVYEWICWEAYRYHRHYCSLSNIWVRSPSYVQRMDTDLCHSALQHSSYSHSLWLHWALTRANTDTIRYRLLKKFGCNTFKGNEYARGEKVPTCITLVLRILSFKVGYSTCLIVLELDASMKESM